MRHYGSCTFIDLLDLFSYQNVYLPCNTIHFNAMPIWVEYGLMGHYIKWDHMLVKSWHLDYCSVRPLCYLQEGKR
jgi:hypothetical protein